MKIPKPLLYSTLIAGVIVIGIFTFSVNDSTDEAYFSDFTNNYSIYAVQSPDSISFAGEIVPLYYFDVRESLDRELLINTYWHSQTLLHIKLANRYLHIIKPILEKNGIPSDFQYIPLAESGFKNVISPKGATGYWQFLKETAKEHGLEVTNEIDERYHLVKSTEAACQFFKKSYEDFGSWTLAAATYNVGRKRIKTHIRNQEEKNYYNLYMNQETSRYIYRIIAIKLVIENPRQYGFKLREKDLYQPIHTKQIEVTSTIENLPEFARKNNTNYKLLKMLNPWLRSSQLTVTDGKQYVIDIPAAKARIKQ
jgi:hypothetical protein